MLPADIIIFILQRDSIDLENFFITIVLGNSTSGGPYLGGLLITCANVCACVCMCVCVYVHVCVSL